LLICKKPLPDAIVPQVRGGRPGTEIDNGKMIGDYLVEMTTDEKMVWEWQSWEHLYPVADGITAVQDNRDGWPFANGFCEWPDGNIMLSFRNISTVVMIDRRTGEIYWKLGAPSLSGQHAPTMLPNGHILIFDNGPHTVWTRRSLSRARSKSTPRPKISCENTKRPRCRISLVPRYRTLSVCRMATRSSTKAGSVGSSRLPTKALWSGSTSIHILADPRGHSPQEQTNQVYRAYRYTTAEIARAQAAT
jgi:hypothetical protein